MKMVTLMEQSSLMAILAEEYYDPAEDARSGEEDRCTGWWYVDCD